MSNFKNKVVVVTGSSIGIGKTLAKQLLDLGAQVLINGRNSQRLDAAVEFFRQRGREPLAVVGDVSQFEDCQQIINAAIKRWGRIDVLVNNAGISMEGELERLNPEVFRRVVEVNLIGSVNATQAALPSLKKTKGRILMISSVAGFSGLPRYSAYSASKMALTSLVQSLRAELYGTGVHVGIAYVGFTENDPDKQILNARGETVPQPVRKFVRSEPVDKVAREIIQMLARRQDRRVFSPLGKLAALTNRISPALFHWLIQRKYLRHYSDEQWGEELGEQMENSHLDVAR